MRGGRCARALAGALLCALAAPARPSEVGGRPPPGPFAALRRGVEPRDSAPRAVQAPLGALPGVDLAMKWKLGNETALAGALKVGLWRALTDPSPSLFARAPPLARCRSCLLEGEGRRESPLLFLCKPQH